MARKENCYHLGNNLYHVRTQAGFRKAFKAYAKFKEIDFGNFSNIRGYPKVYSSVVQFYNHEYLGVWTVSMSLEECISKQEALLFNLRQQDELNKA